MPTDYGSDLTTFAGAGGTIGADPLFLPISGPRVVVERVARRLMTPKGALPGFPEWGLDLMALIGKRMTNVEIERTKKAIQFECEDDEAVESARVVGFEPVAGGIGHYRIQISLTLAEGPFELVLGVSDVGVELLRAS